jgi:ADP-ribose pyrophosphatase
MEPEWPVVESRVEWETDYVVGGVDVVERPDGEHGRYYWLDVSDSVTVVAIDDGDLVLVEQYRPRLRERFLECPGGGIDGEESVETAARRELREETGFVADSLTHRRSYRQSGWLRTTTHVVVARDLAPGPEEPEDGEFLDVHVLPVEETLDRVRRGSAAGWTLIALLVAREAGDL